MGGLLEDTREVLAVGRTGSSFLVIFWNLDLDR
jgi:hypothetical protein